MREDRIRVKPFTLLNMLRFEMYKQENEHSVVHFAGHMTESMEEDYIMMVLSESWAEVSVMCPLETDDAAEVLDAVHQGPVDAAAGILSGKSCMNAKDLTKRMESGNLPNTPFYQSAIEIVTKNEMADTKEDTMSGCANIAALMQKTGIMKTKDVGQLLQYVNLLKPQDAMDVLNGLSAVSLIKDKGVRNVLGMLNALQRTGILGALNERSPKEIAESSTAKDVMQEEKVLLKGVITELRISTENGVKVLSGTVQSGTYLMGTMPHIRTWQDAGITYQGMIDTLLATYEESACIMTAEDRAIPYFVAQYNESDWDFARRIASQLNEYLVAEDVAGGVKFFFGMPKRSDPVELKTNRYAIRKSLGEYLFKKDHALTDTRERDAMQYIIKVREVYYVGDKINLNDRQLYVSKVESKLEGGELYHTYYLKELSGFTAPKDYNQALIGASLAANIAAVQNDVVQITVQEDENPEAGVRWFPYSTVYSSPDGTGWYCMPEPGDEVRLYLPDQDEVNAYVVSSTHLATSETAERCNPDYKSLMNKYNKEVLLTPDTLIFTNNAGMSVEILDNEGIRIISNKKITVKSEEAVEISSTTATLKIIAPESITLIQGGTQVNLNSNVLIKGAKVHMD